MSARFLPFNKPYLTGRELAYMQAAADAGHLSGDGAFTRRCHAWLEEKIGCRKALLTHSCTAGLEMAALLADLAPGDEVIMPSFTFVSTANACALRGAVPVFVDIRPDTLNIDETLIARALTPRTRAIVAVHYAGVSCEMDAILAVARSRDLLVIEDAAQALGSTWHDRPLGSLGQLAAMSFHETKNIVAGEGGALLVNADRFVARAEIIREKGTDRSRFLRGQTDKYTWVDLGSSYLPSDLTAAFLWAQMEEADWMTARRLEVWTWYYDRFAELEARGVVRRPVVPAHCRHNAHLFYLLAATPDARSRVLAHLGAHGVNAVFHYVPLHSSPAGRRLARVAGSMHHTDSTSHRLLRLPLWIGMGPEDVDRVATTVEEALQ